MIRKTIKNSTVWLLTLVFLVSCSHTSGLTHTTLTLDALRTTERTIRWPAAHRGDRESGEENTAHSIRSAVTEGVPLIEVDVRANGEGYLFLFHDRRVSERNAPDNPEYWGSTVTTLSTADLGQLKLSTHQAGVTSFIDALRTVSKSHSALLLDIKNTSHTLIDAILNTIKQAQAEEYVIIQCSSPLWLRLARTYAPELAVLARIESAQEISDVTPYRPEIVQVDAEWITEEWIRRIKRSGSRVLVKTLAPGQDTQAVWGELFERGVDIILTDRPRTMQSFLRATPIRRY